MKPSHVKETANSNSSLFGQANQSKAGKSSPWPYAIVAFFLVVAAFNFVFVRLAINSSVPPISEHPYEEGLRFQEVLDAKNRAFAAGLEAEFSFSPAEGAGNRTVRVDLTRAKRQEGVRDAKVSLRIFRPSAANMDVTGILVESPDQAGRYSSVLHLPLPGLWLFELNISLDGKDYFIEKREMLP